MKQRETATPPDTGKITVKSDGTLAVPSRPIIPFIEGDGVGPDIMAAAKLVWNSAVGKAYGGERQVEWMEIYAGEKANAVFGREVWLPEETLKAVREYRVAVKGPLTTPVGGGIRSINVALRRQLDLYVCMRPVRWFQGIPSPVKHPELTNMVVFRENTEDIYAGIEWAYDSPASKKALRFLREEMGVTDIRFPDTCAIGVKPISKEGSQRLIRAAIRHAHRNGLPSVTLVHKGNIMKFTEGAFKEWGYELVGGELSDIAVAAADCGSKPVPGKVIVKDVITDAFFQQILTRPAEYSVIATMNLNGDYLSDAIAACVGGLGIAPGANINFEQGTALFEATHGTAPKYAGQDKANPGSLILSGEMMFRHIGWSGAADLIVKGFEKTIRSKTVTYDLARLMDDATEVKCSEFAGAIAANM